MMEQDKERREFVRVPFRTETTVRTPDQMIWASTTLDLSMNGIRIMTKEAAPPLGTPCEIEMVLSETEPAVIIEALGSVVRSEPGTLAVHLTEVDLDSFQHLQQLILNNSDDPEGVEQEFRAHWGIRKPGHPSTP
jgi:hypothetical protein